MKCDAAILPPAGGAPKASQKVRMRGTVMREQRVPMCEAYREAQWQAARDDLVTWLESSLSGASPAERPSAHSAPPSAPNGTDDGGGLEVVLTRNQHRLPRDELLKHKVGVESFEKVKAIYVSGGHWSAFSGCPAVAEVNGSVAKLARCAELITTSCPAPGSQVFESKGQVKVRRKKRKFSEHASSIGSDEQNLDIPKQLKSSEQCLVPGVSWLVLKRPSSRIAQWREAHGIPRGSRTSAEAKRKWRLKRKEANIPVKRGGKTPAWSRIKYVAKVLAKEVAYLLREWMRQPGLKMKKPQANAGRYTFEGKLGSKLEKLARVWDSVPSSLQEELRGIAPLFQWH